MVDWHHVPIPQTCLPDNRYPPILLIHILQCNGIDEEGPNLAYILPTCCHITLPPNTLPLIVACGLDHTYSALQHCTLPILLSNHGTPHSHGPAACVGTTLSAPHPPQRSWYSLQPWTHPLTAACRYNTVCSPSSSAIMVPLDTITTWNMCLR